MLSDFDFPFDPQKIAQHPEKERDQAKLMNVLGERIQHQSIHHLHDILTEEHIVIRNNTKVIRARLLGQKETGGQIEVFLESFTGTESAWVQIKSSKKTRLPFTVEIEKKGVLSIEKKSDHGSFYEARSLAGNIEELFQKYGDIPLPPYIKRKTNTNDETRYQTVFAEVPGSVAAPTAGLHFTHDLICSLQKKGVLFYDITLHIGAGTFRPIRTTTLNEHIMHAEFYRIPESTQKAIQEAKKQKKKIVAVGTTVVRALESDALNKTVDDGWKKTDLFITPGFSFQVVDILLTNFHLPQSSLFVLVSSFSGRENIKKCYEEAIKNNYRFFSYGDAMLIKRDESQRPVE